MKEGHRPPNFGDNEPSEEGDDPLKDDGVNMPTGRGRNVLVATIVASVSTIVSPFFYHWQFASPALNAHAQAIEAAGKKTEQVEKHLDHTDETVKANHEEVEEMRREFAVVSEHMRNVDLKLTQRSDYLRADEQRMHNEVYQRNRSEQADITGNPF